jgi:hypothetical protein
VQDLIERYGAHGEHPDHVRAGWRYLVMNGDTQRGVWEHVVACMEQEPDEAKVRPDSE